MYLPDTAIYTAYDDHNCFDPAESEKNLMRAVLQTAMDDMRRSGEARRDARLFFMANDEIYLLSFLNICRHLDMCSQTVRQLVGVRGKAPICKHM